MSRALPPLTSTASLHGTQRMKHLMYLTVQHPTWKIEYFSLSTCNFQISWRYKGKGKV